MSSGAGFSRDVRPRAGRTVATFPSYRDAERAVERLARAEFPVEQVTIVGRGLQYLEQVTGRVGWGEAALRGACSGAVAGFLVGWLFGLFDWFHPITASGWLALEGLLFGAVFGALAALLIHALTRGRRDFASVGTMTAERFDVVVAEPVAADAARLLNEEERQTEAPPAAATASGSPAHPAPQA
ncbi:MAG TPA: general stress protein [Solirubrobacteraceae bacterium]